MMKDKSSNIKMIGYGLIALYSVSSLIYFFNLYNEENDIRSAVMLGFFVILLTGSVAIVSLKEWGRLLVVFANLIMGLYLLKPYISSKSIVPVGYIFMSFIVFMFFSQPRVRLFFNSNSRAKWRTVLLIDDDQTQWVTVRSILMNHGFSVLVAKTGEEGMQIAKAQKPDLILLDVILPGIKGREVCRRLKSDYATKDIPVIFLTAKNSPDDMAAEKEMGAVAHLTKPVDVKTLVATVKKNLIEK